MSEPTSRKRSLMMLGLIALLGIGAGVAATLLRPARGPQVSPTGGLSIPTLSTDPQLPSPAVHRANLLEQMVQDAAGEPNPRLLSQYESFAIPCRRGMKRCAEVLDRLAQPDVPPALVLAFAKELPRRATDELDRLLLPLLDDPAQQEAAVRVFRDQRRALLGSSATCGCGYGVVPAPVRGKVWLVAIAAGARGLAWDPQPGPQGWTLNLTRDDAGRGLLMMPIEAPPGRWEIAVRPDGDRLSVPGAEPPAEPASAD